MGSLQSILKDSILTQACKGLFRKKQRAPAELYQAINDCTTMQQLLDLLFSTDFIKDEATLKAFDKRIEELEATF